MPNLLPSCHDSLCSTLARTVHLSFIFISALPETTFQFHASSRKPKSKPKRHIDRQQTAGTDGRIIPSLIIPYPGHHSVIKLEPQRIYLVSTYLSVILPDAVNHSDSSHSQPGNLPALPRSPTFPHSTPTSFERLR